MYTSIVGLLAQWLGEIALFDLNPNRLYDQQPSRVDDRLCAAVKFHLVPLNPEY